MKMIRKFEQAATLFLLACCVVSLGSCGSGAVSAPDPAAGTALTVSPGTAEVFPDIPMSFTITGGKPAYTVFSSNNVALPLTSAVNGSTFTIVPNAVAVGLYCSTAACCWASRRPPPN